jgi:hypothetical protein
VSYTGTQVYFPPSTSFDAVRDTLAKRVRSATLSASGGIIRLAFGGTKLIRIARNDASHIPDEAKWHASKATDTSTRAALERASHRYEIEPADPRADPDDMYNELLSVFEVLHEMPDAIGADPFDGALYHNAANASTTSESGKRSVKPPARKAASKQAATKKVAKKSATRSAKPAKKHPRKKSPAKKPPAKKLAAKSSLRRS